MSEKKNQGPKRLKRWSAKRKIEIVLRLLRGETLEELSREIGQPAHVISEWHEKFLAGGETLLKTRDQGEGATHQQEIRRIQAKLGETTMENELLREKIRLIEEKAGFRWGRSKK